MRLRDVKTLVDIPLVPITERQVYMRVADAANGRRLSPCSRGLPTGCDGRKIPLLWCLFRTPGGSCSGRYGRVFAIGGCLQIPSKGYLWFSERWSTRDLSFTGLQLSDKSQSYIASFETLAQITLLHCMTAALPGGRMRARIRLWSDNAASTRLYSRKFPLNIFAQRLALFSCFSGISLDVSHIPGELNEDADVLSRWPGDTALLPERFAVSRRVPLDFEQLWFRRSTTLLRPSDARIPWQLPINDFFM